MASNNEKPKKGFMALYKAAIASPRHRFQLPELKNVAAMESYNSIISRNNKWLLRKPKMVARQEQEQELNVEHIGRREMVAGENNMINGANGNERGRGVVSIEGRKSVSHVETNLGSVVSFLQVNVLVSDMPNYMQVHAFRCARRTFDSSEKFSAKHMAYNIKKEFDKVHGPAWHCIVGSSFGSFVTHATGCFLYFSMENLYILLFKTKIQKAKN